MDHWSCAAEAWYTSMHLLDGLMAPSMLMVLPLVIKLDPLVQDPNKIVFPVTRTALSE